MKTLLYKNIEISYTDQGKGTVVIFLHGFLENKKMWDSFTGEFSKKYRVITIDLLGHGNTGSIGYVHNMEDHADAVLAVLSELRIRKVIFAGHSMGGYVALAFAELYPDYIKGIALINSTSVADNDERKANRNRAIKSVKANHTNFVRLSIANLFSKNNRERLSQEIEQVKKEALKTPLQGIIASLEGMKTRKDREVILHFAPFPVLLVLGKNDPVLNYEESLEQLEGNSVQLISFEDGHMSTIENKDELLLGLSKFFKSI